MVAFRNSTGSLFVHFFTIWFCFNYIAETEYVKLIYAVVLNWFQKRTLRESERPDGCNLMRGFGGFHVLEPLVH